MIKLLYESLDNYYTELQVKSIWGTGWLQHDWERKMEIRWCMKWDGTLKRSGSIRSEAFRDSLN